MNFNFSFLSKIFTFIGKRPKLMLKFFHKEKVEGRKVLNGIVRKGRNRERMIGPEA